MHPKLQNGITKEMDGRYLYEFGTRKPPSNMDELVKDDCWKNFINKWVWSNDCDDMDTLVFFKHIYRDGRVYQIVFSGVDIIGDGVYLLFDARMHIVENNIYVEPNNFDLIRGSWEEEDFLLYLFKHGYITKQEYMTLKDKRLAKEWTKKLPQMRSLPVRDNVQDFGCP